MSLYRIVFVDSRLKFTPFIALASLHLREAPFRAADTAASVASKSAQIQMARAGQIRKLVLPKPPFQLGFVGTGRICVVTNHAGFS